MAKTRNTLNSFVSFTFFLPFFGLPRRAVRPNARPRTKPCFCINPHGKNDWYLLQDTQFRTRAQPPLDKPRSALHNGTLSRTKSGFGGQTAARRGSPRRGCPAGRPAPVPWDPLCAFSGMHTKAQSLPYPAGSDVFPFYCRRNKKLSADGQASSRTILPVYTPGRHAFSAPSTVILSVFPSAALMTAPSASSSFVR